MQSNPFLRPSRLALAMCLLGSASLPAYAATGTPASKIDAQLLAPSLTGEAQEALIEVKGRANKNVIDQNQNYLQRRKAWVDHMQAHAAQAQSGVVSWLKRNRVEHKVYWINNTIWIKADRATLDALAARDDVNFIYGNPLLPVRRPQFEQGIVANATLAGPEWGVAKINAPQVWGRWHYWPRRNHCR